MYNRHYNNIDNNYGERRIDPYSRERRFNNNEYGKNNSDNNLSSPLKISSNLLMNVNRKERFQNENLTVNRISPVHFQYRANFYNDGGEKFDNNSTKQMRYNNSYSNTDINKVQNSQKYDSQNNYNYNNSYTKNKTPNNYYNNNNNNYNNQRNNEYNNNMMVKNNNPDNVNNNRYRDMNITEKDRQYYLKDPTDFYKGEEIDDGFRHYNPEDKNYDGSRYGGYIYNYYLNAPMRGDKSEDWRYPPLYYIKSSYDPKKAM
jgi:hypothetical protein